MVFQHEGAVHQFPDLFRRRWRFDFIQIVERLGGGHMMGGRADPADPAGDLGHVFRGPAQAEDFETPELGDLEIRPLHIPPVIEEDIDLSVSFEPGDRVDGNPSLRDVRLVGLLQALIPFLFDGVFHC
jgi:hypothetical protein